METIARGTPPRIAEVGTSEAAVSAVSWPAIIVGAFAAASITLILLAIGSGMGFASMSPWPGDGASATTFTVMTAIWLIVVQWVSSGVGGYLAGRLRTKWTAVHTHEVFFRDTAHGFATWAVATVLGAMILASLASALAGAGINAAGTAVSGAARGAATAASSAASQIDAYDVDALFRTAQPTTSGAGANEDPRAEATRILGKLLTTQNLEASDRAYLAQSIAARTGISQQEAEARVDQATARVKDAEVKARQAADTARKAAAQASLYTALSMLIGALIASVAAAIGGRQRDEHV
jgi:hypothetical protein